MSEEADIASAPPRGLVLVTGAAGEVGGRLVRRLQREGWRIRALVLPGDPLRSRLAGLSVEICEGDVRDAASLRPAVKGADCVLHLAAVILGSDDTIYDAVNRQGTTNLVAAAAEAGVVHFVYVSSASVIYPQLTPYGRSKLEAELAVKGETRLQHTLVRPTLVYDDEGGGQEIALFRRYLHRFPVVPFIGPTEGPAAARKRPVHADDVVEALARIVGNPICYGRTYNLSGGEAISLPDLGRLILSVEEKRRPFLPLPVRFCSAAARGLALLMKRPPLTPYAVAGFTNHADLDPADAVRDFGYAPRGVREGLAAALRAHARRASVAPAASMRSASTAVPEKVPS